MIGDNLDKDLVALRGFLFEKFEKSQEALFYLRLRGERGAVVEISKQLPRINSL